MTEYEIRVVGALERIRLALESLVMLQVPEEQAAPVCDHQWVDLGDEYECRLCKSRKPQ